MTSSSSTSGETAETNNIGPNASAAHRSSSRGNHPYPRIHLVRSESLPPNVENYVRAEFHDVGSERPSDLPPRSKIYLKPTTRPPPPTRPEPTKAPERSQYSQDPPYEDGWRQRASDNYPSKPYNVKYEFHRTGPPRMEDSGRMPSIVQNYRPHASGDSAGPHLSFVQAQEHAGFGASGTQSGHKRHSRRHRPHVSSGRPPPGDGGGGGGSGNGDIQTAAVADATPDPETLNKIIVCVYRNSRREFVQKEVWLVKPGYRDSAYPLFRTDAAFFKEIKWRYKNQLRGSIRRYISFKTVSTARVLEYGNNRFGLANINEKLFSPVFMKAYNDPDGSLLDPKKYPDDPAVTSDGWIRWFWEKRRKFVYKRKADLAIELVEAYDSARVMGAIAIALIIYFTLTIVWLAEGGDPSYVAGVMSFVLSILAVLVGLTGLYDWLDLGHMGGGKDFLILGEHELDEIDRDGWRILRAYPEAYHVRPHEPYYMPYTPEPYPRQPPRN